MNLNHLFDNKSYIHFTLLGIVCYCSFFLFSDSFFVNIMEARNFVTAREMIEKGNWLVPTMNGELRLAKPPLPTWITALFGMWFGMENLSMLRFPAGLMGSLMVLFIYQFTLSLNNKRSMALTNSLILASSFYVIYMSRTGTWDIFCHSFMLGAIWLLYKAWKIESKNWRLFVSAGVLLGLSFLSKGPVAFFAVLIPFLIAYCWIYDGKIILQKWQPLLLCIAIFMIISFWWPVYISVEHAEEAAAVAKLESGSWLNRHVRPFYYYWNFPIQSGIWTLAIATALLFPYALKNFAAKKEYKFALIWTISSVALLSLIPEKKDRYLLPVLIPSSLLVGQLLQHFYVIFKINKTKWIDQLLFGINTWTIASVAFALPIAVFLIFYQDNLISIHQFILFTLCSELIFVLVLICWINRNVRGLLLNMVALMLIVIIFLIPNIDGLINKNPNFKSIGEVKTNPELNSLNFYSIGDQIFRIELVYQVGKEVKPWNTKEQPVFPENGSFVVFSTENPTELFSEAQLEKMELTIIEHYDNNRHRIGKRRNKEHFKKYVSLVKVKS